MPRKLDVSIRDEGSLILFYGETEEGKRWLDENLDNAIRFGIGYVVEPRYAKDIVNGMIDDGVVVGYGAV